MRDAETSLSSIIVACWQRRHCATTWKWTTIWQRAFAGLWLTESVFLRHERSCLSAFAGVNRVTIKRRPTTTVHFEHFLLKPSSLSRFVTQFANLICRWKRDDDARLFFQLNERKETRAVSTSLRRRPTETLYVVLQGIELFLITADKQLECRQSHSDHSGVIRLLK